MIRNIILFSLIVFAISCKQNNTSKSISKEAKEEITQWVLTESADGSVPVERHEACFVKVQEKFYLLGGRGIRPVSIYDPATKVWTEGTPPPIELHHFQPVVHNNTIYVLCALTGKWPAETPTTHIYTYTPATDKWAKTEEIPEERRRGSTGNVIKGDKIYFTCGIKNGHLSGHKKWMDSYNIKTNEWSKLSDAPRARDHFQAVLKNDKIYVAAGRRTNTVPDQSFGGTVAEVDIYDIATDTWTTMKEPIPTERAGNMAIEYNDEILVLGGESQSQEKAHADVESLNIHTGEWSALPSLIHGRHGTGVIQYGDELYVASGCGNRGGNPELNTMELYSPQ